MVSVTTGTISQMVSALRGEDHEWHKTERYRGTRADPAETRRTQ
jgi:hypothetical protein